ncbi:MAG: hypothetical protein ACI3XM_02710 [Eubacteriales bacterium]
MKYNKQFEKFLFPPIRLILLLTVVSAAALPTVFLYGLDHHPIGYAVYVLSFYTLTVDVIACAHTIPDTCRAVRQKIYAHPYGERYMTDITFKTHISLWLSLGTNLFYVAANLFSGILYRSVWSVTLAVYYTILAVMRFLLLRFVNRNGIGQKRIPELRRARLCGMILLTMNLALSGVVLLVIRSGEGFHYAGMMIYVMALYTFWITITAVLDIIRYRTYSSPVLTVTKTIKFAAALVSMLSLETAMLAEFGSEVDSPDFERIMVGATGAGICLIVTVMSVMIMIRTTKAMRKHEKTEP